jgi:acetyltransferase-like isoleucine patch superfamily enzyme
VDAHWNVPEIPGNVTLGEGTLVNGALAFKRFHSRLAPALVIGASCTMDGVQFALGEEARVEIGDFCYFTNVVLLSEIALTIGTHVVIGWNATIADTDFHPIAPAERIADALACSPLAAGRPRPRIERLPVVIESGAWIGPNATILKGVRVGAGAMVEAGALVTRDVPPRARVLGNPAQVVGEVGA